MRNFTSVPSIIFGMSVCCAPLSIPAEGHHQSGIAGQVMTPAHVVQMPGVGGNPPTYVVVPGAPVQTQVKVFSEKGVLVDEAITDAQGQFALAIKPGTYTLLPAALASDVQPVPTIVTVPKKQWITTTVAYPDTPDD